MKNFKGVVLALTVTVFMFAQVCHGASVSTLKKNSWNAEQSFRQGIVVRNGEGATYNVESKNTSGTTTFAITPAGVATVTGLTGTGVVSATNIADVTKYIQLPLMTFSTNGAEITSTTAPGLEVDDLVPNIVWGDGEVTPITRTFRVPEDYSSGGAFKVLATESNSTTPNEVDFNVYINSDGTAADSSATNQSPVALAGTTSTPDEITLTVATDFSALTAGAWVTLNIWRDDTATGTGDLEVKGVAFYYTGTQ